MSTIRKYPVSLDRQSDGSYEPVEFGPNTCLADEVIADDPIDNAKLADGAVTNLKLGANAVTFDKIANGGVRNSQIQDEAISPAKLNFCLLYTSPSPRDS